MVDIDGWDVRDIIDPLFFNDNTNMWRDMTPFLCKLSGQCDTYSQ
jgi:hypothetical protein